MFSIKKLAGLAIGVSFFGLVLTASTPSASALSDSQLSTIISMLQNFGVPSSNIAGVAAALNGQSTTNPATTNSTTQSCVNLTYNMSIGSTNATTGGQVSQLQQFLGITPTTGYFGRSTQQAVQVWQSSHGVVSSGSSRTTGYGSVGPATRSAMACAGGTNTSSVVPAVTAPASSQGSAGTQGTNTNTGNSNSGSTAQNSSATVSNTAAPVFSSASPAAGESATMTVGGGNTPAPSLPPVNSTSVGGAAARAVSNLARTFWSGAFPAGNITPTWDGIVGDPLKDSRGGLWHAATALDVLYGDWQRNPSGQSGQAVFSEWNYIKSNFSASDFSTCGDSSPQNFGSDDTGWNAAMLLQLYVVTHDALALDYAKSAVTCGFNRWSDMSTGSFNGLWYSDVRTLQSANDYHIKSSYDTGLTADAMQIYIITKDPTYLTYAKESFDWMQSHLLRNDGLYWADYGLQTPYASAAQKIANSPVASDRPNDIHLAGSVTFLGGNMGMGVIAAQLYQATGNATYKQDAINSAQAILSSVLVSNGTFLDDRDAWANGHFVRDWAQQVVPLLPTSPQQQANAVLSATANAIATNDRTSDGYYGGCWSGPLGSSCAWDKAGSTAKQIMTSANAADFIMAAALEGTSAPTISAPAPTAPALSVQAQLLGQTGEDYVGQITQGPDGVKDVHIRLAGVSSPIKSVTVGTVSGAWTYPANGTSWIISVQNESDPTIVDLYLDYYQQYSTYTVYLTLQDGRTATVQTVAVTPQASATLLGQTGEDYVGQITQGADGTKDVHIKLSNVAFPIKSVRIGTPTGAWAYPSDATDWIATLKTGSDPTVADVFFDYYQQYASYTVYLTFTNGLTETVQTQ